MIVKLIYLEIKIFFFFFLGTKVVIEELPPIINVQYSLGTDRYRLVFPGMTGTDLYSRGCIQVIGKSGKFRLVQYVIQNIGFGNVLFLLPNPHKFSIIAKR